MVVQSGFPILSTPDMARSLRFYAELLGGRVFYRWPEQGDDAVYVAMTIGTMRLGIGLDTEVPVGRSGQRCQLWLSVDDCDMTVDALRLAGVTVVEVPQDQPWGERIARVLDPDGNDVIVATGDR